jgi:hypothetical protein
MIVYLLSIISHSIIRELLDKLGFVWEIQNANKKKKLMDDSVDILGGSSESDVNKSMYLEQEKRL